MANERRESILKLIQGKNEIRLSELVKLFPEVTEMTLRRDLDYLAQSGLVSRTHGGAQKMPQQSGTEHKFSSRIVSNIDSKTIISKLAVKLLPQNRSIYLDAGSTMMTFAQHIPDISLYVTTNAPNIALELMKRNCPEVILLGGHLHRTTLSTTGASALNFLDSLNIDIAFMATGGFSIENGFTNPYMNECELKRKVIGAAQKVIVLMDHTKINRTLPFTFATLEDVDIIITDKKPCEQLLNLAEEKSIQVIY